MCDKPAMARVVSIALVLAALSACIPECGQRERLTRVVIHQVADGVALACANGGRAPDRLTELAPPECAGARCVLREVPADHWGHPLVLQKSSGTIRVVSLGADRQLGTADDLVVEVSCASSAEGSVR